MTRRNQATSRCSSYFLAGEMATERELIMGKNQHVTPHKGGGWQVKGAGNTRATAVTRTQAEAMDIGRRISRNQGSELFIHGIDGRIRAKDSHSRDPHPPLG